jgi:hypothetical protein
MEQLAGNCKFVISYLSDRYKMPGKRTRRPRTRKPRARRGKKSSNVSEWASCSVKQTIVAPGPADFACNQMYNLRGVLKLTGFTRAEEIAKAYQFYRIKHVKVTYKFPFDTFMPANVARPNFYSMIDKAEAIPTLATLESLKNMGARPRQCDEKPISLSWKPTVLQASETLAGSSPSTYLMSPWLSTAHPDIQHQGLFWYAEQVLFGGQAQIYHAEVEVQFEFKKPLLYATSATTPAISAVKATLDNSSNGIVDSIA